MLCSVTNHIKMVGGGSQQETLTPGFVLLGIRQQGVLVLLSFTVSDITTEVSGPRLTCRTEMYFQVGDTGSNPSGNISSLKITGTFC
ncbi:unnamed protein product [Schistosoma curassoni]|uniref:ZP domain-containing protein n=1 Tax=Schistosoma curassoni TaxID=6186 RepID=A0A183KPQ7_9TREM|nr:unnamed protein product [Schistosoma curassoni]